MTTNCATEFQSEISILTRVRHKNIVALLSYIDRSDNEKILVYEYIAGGTLGQHLFEWEQNHLEPLTWTKRLMIALDIGRAVEYMHSLASTRFIHRDLKPANVLLGDDMRAKVTDFGVARETTADRSSIQTTPIGTFGYIAPEIPVTGQVTTKVDVYSFGVILMELITGHKVITEGEEPLVSRFTTKYKENRDKILNEMDPAIKDETGARACMLKLAELACACCARDPDERPRMSSVVPVLSTLAEDPVTLTIIESGHAGRSTRYSSVAQLIT
ncbi:hypothetical protein LUZ60_003219 [Juncus effusus]|nr:hypothetical protein LUZ60_003219 [Juncus effusus]